MRIYVLALNFQCKIEQFTKVDVISKKKVLTLLLPVLYLRPRRVQNMLKGNEILFLCFQKIEQFTKVHVISKKKVLILLLLVYY